MHQQLLEAAREDVIKNQISPQLLRVAPKQMDALIDWWLEKLLNFMATDNFREPFVIHGSTQSGKSASTAVGLAVCRALRVPCAVLTKGNRESIELNLKLQDFANENAKDLVAGKKSLLRKNMSNRAEVMRVLEKGGAFVVADSKVQMEKLNNTVEECWKGKKFAAQIDEGKP